MNKLYFKRSNGERIEIGTPNDQRECLRMIYDHLKNFPNFKSYYTRIWTTPDDKEFHCPVTWFDVGDYNCFYLCTGLNMEDFASG